MILYFLLFLAAFVAWFIGTITAGGAAILFLLLLTAFLPITIIPVMIAFVATFAGIYRAYVYRHEIYWPILKWLLPATIIGAVVGASVFSAILTKQGAHYLDLILAVVLIICGIMGFLNKNKLSGESRVWYFLPAGLAVSILSGMIGGSAPIINSLYQRFSLAPNQIVATKSINLFVLQLTKSIVYILFIFLHYNGHIQSVPGMKNIYYLVLSSLLASIGAAIGISMGKRLLNRLNEQIFKMLMNGMLIMFGCYFLILWLK